MFIYNNGNTPTFKVFTTKKGEKTHIAVFKLTTEGEIHNYDTLIATFVAKGVSYGKVPKSEQCHLLIMLNKTRYVFIGGTSIYSFVAGFISEFQMTFKDNIARPYAIDDKNNTYLFNDSVILMNLTTQNYKNPYDYYQDHRIIVGTETVKAKQQFKLVIDETPARVVAEFYVGDTSTVLEYQPLHKNHYDTLVASGSKTYIVFEDSPTGMISIDKDDYVQIMKTFEASSHFRSFKMKRTIN